MKIKLIYDHSLLQSHSLPPGSNDILFGHDLTTVKVYINVKIDIPMAIIANHVIMITTIQYSP